MTKHYQQTYFARLLNYQHSLGIQIAEPEFNLTFNSPSKKKDYYMAEPK